MRMLIKWPTRGRPQKFLETLARWRAMLSGRNQVHFLISVDEDDAAMNQPAMRQALAAMANLTLRVGPAGRSKIAACNADVDAWVGQTSLTPQVLVLASDDMVPQVAGYDAIITTTMAEVFLNLDGALHFDDGYHGGKSVITLSVLGWNLYTKFGYLYQPEYQSFFCDNEFTAVTRALGAYHYDPRVIVRHCHIGRTPDALYRRNQACWTQDQNTYQRRGAAGFGLREPELSILIPTLPVRLATLQALLENLNRQIAALPDPWAVEIRINRDDGEKPVGVKRNELLAASRGRYVAFIDDDQVAVDYIAEIRTALARQPGVDCVVFGGELTVDRQYAGHFDFGLEHRHYYQQGGVYYRTPNHLCPVKRALALATGFPGINRGEDTDYAVRLYPRLQSQTVVWEPVTASSADPGRLRKKTLYWYHFSPRGTKTQKPIT
ncbi:MAG: glycosyltransferase family 2 protein [Phycisphaerae bacterium]|nr:glycosyltransferase family 2 protein [Phycisphaerae bacterium]